MRGKERSCPQPVPTSGLKAGALGTGWSLLMDYMQFEAVCRLKLSPSYTLATDCSCRLIAARGAVRHTFKPCDLQHARDRVFGSQVT